MCGLFSCTEFSKRSSNNAIVLASECEINARADETLLKISGSGGVDLDNKSILDCGSSWCLDLNKKVVSINPKGKEKIAPSWDFGLHKLDHGDYEKEEEPHL